MEHLSRRPSRRSVLKAGGVAVGAFLPWRLHESLAGAHSKSDGGNTGDGGDGQDPKLDLANIQGNVLAGFNKDHQRLLFFRLADRDRGRRWLSTIVDETATTEEVLAFNELFRRSRSRRRTEITAPQATWLNVALTHAGLTALGVGAGELALFPEAFRQGMATRAAMLGDVEASDPANWVAPFASTDGVHGVLILAADTPDAVDRFARTHDQRMAAQGVTVVGDETGSVRADQPGHEHFGFKDGVSQPGIRGVSRRQNPNNHDQGLPGQDLVWPGEFVVGYPTQIATPDPKADEQGANHNPGPRSRSGPAWTTDGSYLVFRRLRQDVPGFRRMLADGAAAQGIGVERFGAKLVGRYASGAPLERTDDQPAKFDPSVADPSVKDPGLLDATRVNNFEFGDDANGRLVPRAAHIRKAYPRNSRTPTGGEADTQTHRLLRRGIPYGASFREGAPAGSPEGGDADRGLLFLAYQSSLERQFEFVTREWFNKTDHPQAGDGHDPVISQASRKTFNLPGGRPAHLTMQPFITTTGGAYLFQPSISALRTLSSPVARELPSPPRPQPPTAPPEPPPRPAPRRGPAVDV